MRILLVEDEALVYILKKNNYLADGVLDSRRIYPMARRTPHI